ncbi:winged helix-turn-helix transcriptional regulator [Salinirubellus sp. GCM10025818]|uniref:winged helix-turn-helix transcriptional regulator n=1 Tax=Salinirubellus TaxID=2162630 RepID=UPI0030CFCE00
MSSTEPQITPGRKGTVAHPQESLISMTDLFGRKWCPVVLYRLLRDGPMGFSELKRDIDGISGKMLTESLDTLEGQYQVVERSVVSDRPFRVTYEPTERGESLAPLLREMLTWATEHMDPEVV